MDQQSYYVFPLYQTHVTYYQCHSNDNIYPVYTYRPSCEHYIAIPRGQVIVGDDWISSPLYTFEQLSEFGRECTHDHGVTIYYV